MKPELTIRELSNGKTDWSPRQGKGKDWFQTGVFTGKNGMAVIRLSARMTVVRAVFNEAEYILTYPYQITPMAASKNAAALLQGTHKIQQQC